ncbi:MAG: hypothetical protein WCK27_25320 [Verrucomicrobiota bacterium]
MSVFQTISQKAGEAGLPFLIIGGYAVMAHGFVRATDDIDLLVQGGRRDQWRRLLEGLGMKMYREAPAFIQFDPPPDGGLPVDLMLTRAALSTCAAPKNQILISLTMTTHISTRKRQDS